MISNAAMAMTLVVIGLVLWPVYYDFYPISFELEHERIRSAVASVDVLKKAYYESNLFPDGDKSERNVAVLAPRYRLSFSLMVPPETRNPVDWDVQEALRRYIDPILHGRVGALSRFEIDSQVLYFSQLASKPQKKNTVTTVELADILSANDWNAQSMATAGSERETALHFMLYIPPNSNFTVKDSDGHELDDFIVPRWGGIALFPGSVENYSWLSADDLESSFARLGEQLEAFLGASPTSSSKSIRKRWLVHYLVDTAATLGSLSELIEGASEMIILDRVAAGVSASLQDLEEVLRACESSLSSCISSDMYLDKARASLEAAEMIFFDPTLLPQLYHPLEHYLSVYFPLLIPIAIPFFKIVARLAGKSVRLL